MLLLHLFLDSMVEDMDVDLDKEFLQDLKDLKVLITDKDMMDQHKRSGAMMMMMMMMMIVVVFPIYLTDKEWHFEI
ncbi:UNVERIFIED_CONTAM: hypothetical protein FKN15_020204 [Acipenser sinensis]